MTKFNSYFKVFFVLISLLFSTLICRAEDDIKKDEFKETYPYFTDISDNNGLFFETEYVKTNGIFTGYPDGSFKPYNTITRAEFTKIIIESKFSDDDIDSCIYNNANDSESYVFFTDVPKSEWFSKYVCTARMNGVIDGFPDGTFKPGEEIAFTEAAKIMVNTFRYEKSKKEREEDWFAPYVKVLSEKKAIPTSIFAFDSSLVRFEVADMIYRLQTGFMHKPSWTYEELYNFANLPGNRNESYSDYSEVPDHEDVLIVFLYLDDPLDEAFKNKIIGTKDNNESLMYVETWIDNEAKRYNVDFKRNFVFYPEQVKVPEEFARKEKNDKLVDVMVTDIHKFEDWLVRTHPDMFEYNTIGLITYDSKRNLNYTPIASHCNFNDKEFFYGGYVQFRKQWNNYNFDFDNIINFNDMFTHEFFHTEGAIDKYIEPRGKYCTIDQFGVEYDGHDLFCGNGEWLDEETGKMMGGYRLRHLQITEPTAREIGFINRSHITEKCLTRFPEIVDVKKYAETDENVYLNFDLEGCIAHTKTESQLIRIDQDRERYSKENGASIQLKRDSSGDTLYKNNLAKHYQYAFCFPYSVPDIDNYNGVFNFDMSVCGQIIEIDTSDYSWKVIREEIRH